ncbi:hypothetical protein [Paraburkholderia unamae]|uniref:Uncharacterized protein n=1 Tax=Paraburkholderia unamae TaxID=219649 RepID=A0ABX5KV38_9BURK|nr:hypothetical protein [Paraburkholderia unamae]PVX97530.1 hypothetical protein C7402_101241 [Paraburkholderia unamae]RAR66816.1 hypothetical protein C7401_102241 [Paraburkholderia unamae]CAG9273175.1 conserved hypothetical protein [Paraburkholderia unamae]
MKFIDDEIAHITRAMAPSLSAGTRPAVFSFDYWYKRLAALLDLGQITPAQFRTIDALMVELEAIKRTVDVNTPEPLAA